ncbi:MAG TPA: thiopurine S-methyltransferase, partial [Myxococcales bacterium]|nr:thiopurine S-methyltransferase [Myxococcales bacterium]
GGRVLVPLCGKSSDMIWLREQGHSVLGVELSAVACQAFFDDNNIAYERTSISGYERWRAVDDGPDLEIMNGDFFALKKEQVPKLSAVYDRASMIALPPALRLRHAQQLAMLLATGASGLLIHIWYPQEQKSGPPFSVDPEMIVELLGEHFELNQLALHDLMEDPKMATRWPLSSLERAVVRLRRGP